MSTRTWKREKEQKWKQNRNDKTLKLFPVLWLIYWLFFVLFCFHSPSSEKNWKKNKVRKKKLTCFVIAHCSLAFSFLNCWTLLSGKRTPESCIATPGIRPVWLDNELDGRDVSGLFTLNMTVLKGKKSQQKIYIKK